MQEDAGVISNTAAVVAHRMYVWCCSAAYEAGRLLAGRSRHALIVRSLLHSIADDHARLLSVCK